MKDKIWWVFRAHAECNSGDLYKFESIDGTLIKWLTQDQWCFLTQWEFFEQNDDDVIAEKLSPRNRPTTHIPTWVRDKETPPR